MSWWVVLLVWLGAGMTCAIIAVRLEQWDEGKKLAPSDVATTTGGLLVFWPLAVAAIAVTAAFFVPFGIVMLATGWRPDWWNERMRRRRTRKALRTVDAEMPDLRELL